MKITTLLNAMRDDLSNNADLLAWCVANYGRAPYIYSKGIDDRNPPKPESHYPVIVLKGDEKTIDSRGQTQQVIVVCGVYDDAKNSITGKPQIIEYAGPDNLEDFRRLVRDIVRSIALDGDHEIRLSATTPIDAPFPSHLCGMVLEIIALTAMGQDPDR